MIEIKPSFIARMLSPFCQNNYLCSLNNYEIEFSDNNELKKSLLSIKKIVIQKGLIWSRVSIIFENKKSILLAGINSSSAEEIKLFINHNKSFLKETINKVDDNYDELKKIGEWLKDATLGLFWISEYDKKNIFKSVESYAEILNLLFTKIPFTKKIIPYLSLMSEFHNNPEVFKDNCNKLFIPTELKKYEIFFDKVDRNPLTIEQRKAIVTNEDSTLVVAAAGSGKTSLLMGKINYLIKKGMANENEILVLAFNRNAKEEIIERLKNININCETHTFHSFGLKVLAKANKKKESLASFVENANLFDRFIQKKIEELIKNSKKFNEIKEFFISYFFPYQDKFNFQSLGEYYQFIKSSNLITLKGEYVKSMEELEIANFFFTNGIPYEYEKKYEFETSSIERRQYKPDFYLPKNKIYIEHLALNRNNQTPEFINQDEYLSGVEWKRKIHKKNNTKLIETYSFQKREGNLTNFLFNKLQSEGVIFKPLNSNQLLLNLNQHGYISIFAKICGPFLNLYKGKDEEFDSLKNKLNNKEEYESKRILMFLHLFTDLFESYEEELKKIDEIDFHDMINRANQVILNDNCYSKFKFILVDEFQDISFGRAKLINNLQKISPNLKLLAVGDDWQSIYRFTGADIDLMSNFKKYFGFTKQLLLTKTFRFDSSIEKVASFFIKKNPNQIDKNIIANQIVNFPSIKLFLPEKESGKFLEKIVSDISKDSSKNSKVLFLGRNNYSESGIDYKSLKFIAPNLDFEFRTVHRAKGYESDYVVILDMKRARNGFPNEMIDDPIINFMLSEKESFSYAEERRLFYVALTRAKKHVYVIADPASPSSFFNELAIEKDYLVEKINVTSGYKRECPLCKTSPLMERTSAKGNNFFGCQNYPLCEYTADSCRICNFGYLEKFEDFYVCDNKECNHKAEICPKCKTGYLIQKPGKFGLFLGCSNYFYNDCDYTRNIDK